MASSFAAFTAGICPPSAEWTTDQIPDLSGKVVIVTGGNAGIGTVTCKYLLLHNAKVYMACRSAEKAKAAIDGLKETTGKECFFLRCDLADLPSIKDTVADFLSKETKLDILFNSAGVMTPPIEQITKQGYDMQFGTNVLGHAYLTKLLLPTLLATAKECPDGHVRVINTSSSGHGGAPKGGIDYETLKDSPIRKKKHGTMVYYGQSKWGNIVFSNELARRYGDQGIISCSLHPGGIRTELQRHVGGFTQRIFDSMLKDADPWGALTQLYAGTRPEGVEFNGKYLIPWARVADARKDTYDVEAGKKLWEWIDEQLKDL